MTIITMELDCHAYPWHLPDDYFPECGPDNLIRMAEQYGILIRYLGDGYLQCRGADWGWWYEVTGPVEHVIEFLIDEYAGDRAQAVEMVQAHMEWEVTHGP